MNRRYLSKPTLIVLWMGLAMMTASCLHAAQETTCKAKFKRKYNCPFSKITVVEDTSSMGNHLKLRGCGKTVIYDGTKEKFVEK